MAATKYRTGEDRAEGVPWRDRPVMTGDEVARELLIGRSRCYELLASGAIPGKLAGLTTVRVSTRAFREYLGELPPEKKGKVA